MYIIMYVCIYYNVCIMYIITPNIFFYVILNKSLILYKIKITKIRVVALGFHINPLQASICTLRSKTKATSAKRHCP